MSVKEQYWKYSLITIILGLGLILFIKMSPFMGGILGACTIYIMVRKQMFYLTQEKHFKKSITAILLLIEAIMCFLVPLSLAVWLLINKLQTVNVDTTGFIPVSYTHLDVYKRQVYDYGTSKVVGRDQEHIKLELVDNKSLRPARPQDIRPGRAFRGRRSRNRVFA